MVRDVEVRDLGCGFKVVISCLGVRVEGLGFRVWGLGLQV